MEEVPGLGTVPPVDPEDVQPSVSRVGQGMVPFGEDEEFARSERIATHAEQINLDLGADRNMRFIQSMELPGGQQP